MSVLCYDPLAPHPAAQPGSVLRLQRRASPTEPYDMPAAPCIADPAAQAEASDALPSERLAITADTSPFDDRPRARPVTQEADDPSTSTVTAASTSRICPSKPPSKDSQRAPLSAVEGDNPSDSKASGLQLSPPSGGRRAQQVLHMRWCLRTCVCVCVCMYVCVCVCVCVCAHMFAIFSLQSSSSLASLSRVGAGARPAAQASA